MGTNKFKIFVDFDGTITREDIGEAIFRKFGNPEIVNRIISELLEDKISSRECWESLCNSADIPDEEVLNNYINQFEIDQSFKTFLDYCSLNDHEVFILSDGFDYYIDKIFSKENFTGLNYFSNKLELVNGRLKPSFPFFNPEFASSANCKRDHILDNSSDEDYTVYIGDGNSDKEAVHYCDFIFAKNDLLRYCEIERISFHPFRNFNDVIEKLDLLAGKKKLKKRHQAFLKRREAYLLES